ncbi:VanZ family protein [Neobacillus niacini]|uniref:VanZ family protein n=1 Tax=Neobacillus niacini TaxID=86668 RepID=UPI003B02E41C
MRNMVIFVWCAVILVFTCVSSFQDFIHFGVLRFRWDSHPPFSHFLLPLPYNLSRGFLLQKLGHIAVFQVLTYLLLVKYRSRCMILIVAAAFAALTEILQLFFTRGGRAFDVGFDLIGILLALALAGFFRMNHYQQINLKN